MSHEQTPKNLPWLDRLAVWVPGYGGYLDRSQRRSDDRMLREAVAGRLAKGKSALEEAVRQCVDRGALTEIAALERLQKHLDRAIDRLRSAGSGTDDFWTGKGAEGAKADPLHAIDLSLFERADRVIADLEAPDNDHNRLAKVEADLADFESEIDRRTLMLQNIR